MAETIFITGGSGYVGRNFIREFISQGHVVRALTRSDSSAQVVRELGAEPVMGDLLDRKAIIEGCQGVSWVVHCAADLSSGEITEEQTRVNREGTQNVMDGAKAGGAKAVLHISTEAVLADGNPIVMADETTPYPAKPAGGYSHSKAEAERIVLKAAENGVPVFIMRPRFIWGRDDSTLLPNLIAAVKDGRLAWISGGTYLTSTTHIANLVHAGLLMMEKAKPGEIYFITDGPPLTFKSILTDMLATRGLEPPNKAVPRGLIKTAIFLSKLLGRTPPVSKQELALIGNEVTVTDAKARAELGYAPVISVAEGLDELRDRSGN